MKEKEKEGKERERENNHGREGKELPTSWCDLGEG